MADSDIWGDLTEALHEEGGENSVVATELAKSLAKEKQQQQQADEQNPTGERTGDGKSEGVGGDKKSKPRGRRGGGGSKTTVSASSAQKSQKQSEAAERRRARIATALGCVNTGVASQLRRQWLHNLDWMEDRELFGMAPTTEKCSKDCTPRVQRVRLYILREREEESGLVELIRGRADNGMFLDDTVMRSCEVIGLLGTKDRLTRGRITAKLLVKYKCLIHACVQEQCLLDPNSNAAMRQLYNTVHREELQVSAADKIAQYVHFCARHLRFHMCDRYCEQWSPGRDGYTRVCVLSGQVLEGFASGKMIGDDTAATQKISAHGSSSAAPIVAVRAQGGSRGVGGHNIDFSSMVMSNQVSTQLLQKNGSCTDQTVASDDTNKPAASVQQNADTNNNTTTGGRNAGGMGPPVGRGGISARGGLSGGRGMSMNSTTTRRRKAAYGDVQFVRSLGAQKRARTPFGTGRRGRGRGRGTVADASARARSERAKQAQMMIASSGDDDAAFLTPAEASARLEHLITGGSDVSLDVHHYQVQSSLSLDNRVLVNNGFDVDGTRSMPQADAKRRKVTRAKRGARRRGANGATAGRGSSGAALLGASGSSTNMTGSNTAAARIAASRALGTNVVDKLGRMQITVVVPAYLLHSSLEADRFFPQTSLTSVYGVPSSVKPKSEKLAGARAGDAAEKQGAVESLEEFMARNSEIKELVERHSLGERAHSSHARVQTEALQDECVVSCNLIACEPFADRAPNERVKEFATDVIYEQHWREERRRRFVLTDAQASSALIPDKQFFMHYGERACAIVYRLLCSVERATLEKSLRDQHSVRVEHQLQQFCNERRSRHEPILVDELNNILRYHESINHLSKIGCIDEALWKVMETYTALVIVEFYYSMISMPREVQLRLGGELSDAILEQFSFDQFVPVIAYLMRNGLCVQNTTILPRDTFLIHEWWPTKSIRCALGVPDGKMTFLETTIQAFVSALADSSIPTNYFAATEISLDELVKMRLPGSIPRCEELTSRQWARVAACMVVEKFIEKRTERIIRIRQGGFRHNSQESATH